MFIQNPARLVSSQIARFVLLVVLISIPSVPSRAQQVIVTLSSGTTSTPFLQPQYVTLDGQGNLFVADTGHGMVRRIDKLTGAVTIVAGTGAIGSSGDGGPATAAQLNCPAGMAFGSNGSLLIADTCAHVVRKVSPGSDTLVTGASDEIITTYAGDGTEVFCSTDGVSATSTGLCSPFGLAVDQSDNLYIVTTAGDGTFVRRVVASSNLIYTVLGAPPSAQALAFDSAGDLIVSSDIPDVVMLSPSSPGSVITGQEPIQLVLGALNSTGYPLTAELGLDYGLALDNAGALYISDFNVFVEYKLVPGANGLAAAGGSVNVYAGKPDLRGFTGDGGLAANATLAVPGGIAVNSAGTLFIADTGNSVVRAVINGTPTTDSSPISPPDQNGDTSAVTVTFQGGIVEPGTTALAVSQNAPALPSGFQLADGASVFYDVVTTAVFNGPVEVCVNLNPVPNGASLLHFNEATMQWENFTQQPAPTNGPICTVVNSLSPFAVAVPIQQNTAPAITSLANATFQVGSPASFTVTSTGSPTPAVSLSGILPGGVSFGDNGNGTATLAGTASAGSGGVYPVTLTAANGVNPNATQSFVLTVNQAPAITSANNATFAVGANGSFTVTASGFPLPVLSESGALPSGVTFNATTGSLSGVPGNGGVFNLTFTAHNGITPDATQNFTLTVNQSPAITGGNATTFTVGASGSFVVTATGYPAPSLSESGALPNGVTFNPATGALSGTPTQSGVFSLTFTAHNGVGSDAAQSFSLTVNQGSTITSANHATCTVGTASSFAVTSTGFPTPTLTETGALPSGFSFVDNGNGTGVLGGTPSVSGTFNISFTASNGVGGGATQNFTLTVSGSGGGPIATVTPASINFGSVYLYHLASSKVTVQNTGTSTLTISKVSLTLGANTDWDDFFFLNSCGSSLAAGKSCTIYVYYFADEVGTRTATLNIADNAPGGTQTVSLTGTAIKKGH